jgi:hypothetical protein
MQEVLRINYMAQLVPVMGRIHFADGNFTDRRFADNTGRDNQSLGPALHHNSGQFIYISHQVLSAK